MCNNCNKFGHYFHQCRLPITSYGVIVYRKNKKTGEIEFLMIRRKDTFGYIDFLRGKYQIYNVDKIQQLIDEMSNDEKHKLLTIPFPELWKQLWSGQNSRADETTILRKFEMLLNNEVGISLEKLIENSSTSWIETEWEFPKGRKNYQEKDLECSLREFEEETGYSRSQLHIIENVIPYDEIFIGSNNKSYKHKYYLAKINYDYSLNDSNFQKSEIGNMGWFKYEDAIEKIRDYNIEKIEILTSIQRLLQNKLF